MWHGKSPISRASGYSQGRVVRRGGQDSSIRNTNKSDSLLGAISLIGLFLFVGMCLALLGIV